MRKLIEGGSKHSFGIHVAKMAGMPREIVERANSILAKLETKSIQEGDITEKIPAANQGFSHQLSIFETVDETAGKIKEALLDIDINTMSPIDCMLKLNEMKKLLEE
jgi:DNA mismatch repair protein MutS